MVQKTHVAHSQWPQSVVSEWVRMLQRFSLQRGRPPPVHDSGGGGGGQRTDS